MDTHHHHLAPTTCHVQGAVLSFMELEVGGIILFKNCDQITIILKWYCCTLWSSDFVPVFHWIYRGGFNDIQMNQKLAHRIRSKAGGCNEAQLPGLGKTTVCFIIQLDLETWICPSMIQRSVGSWSFVFVVHSLLHPQEMLGEAGNVCHLNTAT